jgi:hypothetical protein
MSGFIYFNRYLMELLMRDNDAGAKEALALAFELYE